MQRNLGTLCFSLILAAALAASGRAHAQGPDHPSDAVRKALGVAAKAPITAQGLLRKSRELRESEGHVFFDAQGKADPTHFLKARAREVAVAQPLAPPRAVRRPVVIEKLFPMLGKVKSGRIQHKDFRGGLRQYRALDPWGRGYVTLDDLKAAKELGRRAGSRIKAVQFIKKLDKNGDRRISRDEFPAKSLKLFERLDANRDGALTFEEMVQYVAKRAEAKRAKKVLR